MRKMENTTKSSEGRRSETRLKIKKDVKIICTSSAGEATYGAVLEEVNKSGMSLSVASSVILSPRIKIEVEAFSGFQKIALPATVRWQSENGSTIRIGAEFRRLNFDQTKFIDSFIKEAQQNAMQQPARRKIDRRIDVREARQYAESNAQIIGQLRKKLRQRVAITGIGVISPMGIGHQILWEKVSSGYSAIEAIDITSAGGEKLRVLAGKVNSFNALEFLDIRKVRKMQRSSQFACAAATLAMQDAGLSNSSQSDSTIGLYVGTIVGGMEKIFEESNACVNDGVHSMDPLIGFTGSWDDAASQVAMHLNINGSSQTVCTGCASSTDAIGLGFRAIQRGDLDIALVGGTDAPLSMQIVGSFLNLGILSNNLEMPKTSMKPFDSERDGFVLGEGATFLILENLDKARLRDANIYGELVGYGASCDAYSPTSRDPLGNGLALAISNALADAEIKFTDIDYVNLHGTATKDGDRSEAYAIRKIFQRNAEKISFGFLKPMIGHMQGACGATEAALTILAMKNNQPAPILNLKKIDPECRLNFLASQPLGQPIRIAMSMNSGFGGKNAVLIYRSIEEV